MTTKRWTNFNLVFLGESVRCGSSRKKSKSSLSFGVDFCQRTTEYTSSGPMRRRQHDQRCRFYSDFSFGWGDESLTPVKLAARRIRSSGNKQPSLKVNSLLRDARPIPLQHQNFPDHHQHETIGQDIELFSLKDTEKNSNSSQQACHIIMLHGLFGSNENFQLLSKKLLNELEQHHPVEVHCVDLRNHGDSPSADDHSYPLMATDLDHYMDNENIERAILIGHSMGGKTAMYYTLAMKPERIKALISIDIAPVSYLGVTSHTFRFDLLRKALPPVHLIQSKDQVDTILANYLPDKAERAYLLKNLIENSEQKTFEWKINLDVLFRFQYRILDFPLITSAPYQGPCLFIGGSKSHRLNPEYQSSISNLFPAAKVNMVAGGGHFVHAQKPSTVASLIATFLKEEKCV